MQTPHKHFVRGATFMLPAIDPIVTIATCDSFHQSLVALTLKSEPFGLKSFVRAEESVTALKICRKLYFKDIFTSFEDNLRGIAFSEAQIASFAVNCKQHLLLDHGQTLLLTTVGRESHGWRAIGMTQNDKPEIGAIDYDLASWRIEYAENKHQLIVPTRVANLVLGVTA